MSKNKITPADADLFRQTIGTVETVKSDRLLLKPDRSPSARPKLQTPDYEANLDVRGNFSTETVSNEDTLSYLGPGLQNSVLKKLRQGYFGLDAELDLHGLTRDLARHHLLKFLHHCVEDGCRCVHIIHGKGYRSTDNLPILKNHLNLWLRQHNDVQAFCSAAPKDGGAGAVMVLLRISDKYRTVDPYFE